MAIPTGTSSEILANRLFIALVGEKNADLPQIDLFDDAHDIPWDEKSAVYAPVEKISIDELVSQFNTVMGGLRAHLQTEYDAGRITGAKYSEVYIALTQAALTNTVQFALGKDQAFWMAAKTQADAITAQSQNDVVKLEAMLRRATYALTKLKLATEDSTFGTSEFQRTDILPAQKQMVTEQGEAQRAQTANARYSDGQPVGGILGSQKALYDQQKISYQEDTKIKAAKIFSDLWVTMKTVDTGILAPTYIQPPVTEEGHSPYDAIFREIRATAMGVRPTGTSAPEDQAGWTPLA